jgi:hypothetical protein
MHSVADIRAQRAANAALQAEISHALLAVADSLSQSSDQRVVRLLLRTLEASWAEHESFQVEVTFPIVIGRHARRVTPMVGRLRADHANISGCHADIGRLLQRLLDGVVDEPATLELALRAAFALRRDHMLVDAELGGWLPETFSAAELSLCRAWEKARPTPRFPFNVLQGTSRRTFRLGGPLH